jgi:phosphinothricin acetyltransferase
MSGIVSFTYAQASDLEKIVATYNASIPGRFATADLEPVSVKSKLPWFHEHNESTRPLWLVHAGDQYLGWISFSSFYGRPAYSKTVEVSIYLETHAQGKGIGKECLIFAQKEARQRNILTLLGFIFGHNTPSLNLFYAQGFEKWAALPEIADMEGTWRDLIIVGKKVA